MADDVFTAVWRVPGDGYDWRQVRVYGPGERLGADAVWALDAAWRDQTRPRGFREYDPLADRPALFRELAAVDPADRDAVKAFADRSGWLGVDRQSDTLGSPRVETQADWYAHVTLLRDAVALADAAAGRDKARIRRLLRWVGPGEDGTLPPHWLYSRDPAVVGGAEVPGVLYYANDGDWWPGKNDSVAAALVLALGWASARLRGQLDETSVYDRRAGGPAVRVAYKSLIAVAWHQLARAVAGGIEWRRCRERSCGEYFVVAAGRKQGRMAGAVFHHPKCKTKDYKSRLARVTELATAGRTVPQIVKLLAAERLSTDPGTVARWAKAATGGRGGDGRG